jgi:DDE superfamily endonuclease
MAHRLSYSRGVGSQSRTSPAKGGAPCQAPLHSTNRLSPPSFSIGVAICRVGAPFPRISTNGHAWSCCSKDLPPYPTSRPPPPWISTPTRFASGDGVGRTGTSLWSITPGGGGSPLFPPREHALVKAIACEAVSQTKLPLSRLSTTDLADRAAAALGRTISPSTVWRILDADAIKPWRYKYWIFPRDPRFAEKAGRVLDLYAGLWEDQPLGPKDHIISSDEKTSIQARIRCHPTLPTGPKRPMRIEHEYGRGGALQYLAAWDVRRGRVLGRCEAKTGIKPFGRLVKQVMETEPYRSAERVFWIVDNGSSHRGQAAIQRLRTAYRNAILVHTPVHASWLNQVEIYFSIIQRKVLTPNDFASLEEVEQRFLLYEELSNREPRPFDWKFDRTKLQALLERLEAKRSLLASEGVK